MIGDDDRPYGDDRSYRDFRRIASKKAMETKALGETAAAVEKRLRMRRFTWCRAENAVYDDKIWRLAARMSGAPLHLVEAFVLRLDLHASAAKPRGTLDGFSIPALAAHWGTANDDVLARIYAALEHPDIGWIEDDHLVTFWDRNPDTEDTTAADRTHRSKAFKRAMKAIAAYKHEGRIDAAAQAAMIRNLYALREEARAGHFPRGELVRRLALLLQLSTEAEAHVVSGVTTVSLTPRSDQKFLNTGNSVDNRAAAAAGESPGLSEGDSSLGARAADQPARAQQPNADPQAQAELWLNSEGRRIVVVRMLWKPTLAATRIERWWREAGCDYAVLAGIIRRVGDSRAEGARFEALVDDGVKRHAEQTANGPQLGLMPPNPSKGRGQPAEQSGALTAALARLETVRKQGGGHG